MSDEQRRKENALNALDGMSQYLNLMLFDQESFIHNREIDFTVEEIRVRNEALREYRIEFSAATLEAMKEGVSLETINEYQKNFDTKFFSTEALFYMKSDELQQEKKPALHESVMVLNLQSCEEMLKQENAITRGICTTVITELTNIQREFNKIASDAISAARNDKTRKQVTGEQQKIIKRITAAMMTAHRLKDKLDDARPSVRTNTKFKPLEIQNFDGNRGEWENFKGLFEVFVHNSEMKDVEKLGYLKMFITDDFCPIKSWDLNSADYQQAWKAVCEFYGDQRLTVAHHFDGIFKLKSAADGSYEKLQSIVNEARHHFVPLKRMCDENEADFGDAMIAHVVLHRLDSNTKDRFSQENKNQIPLWSKLCPFLEQRAKDILTNLPSNPMKTSASSSSNFRTSQSKPFVKSSTSTSSNSSAKCFTATANVAGAQNSKKHSKCIMNCSNRQHHPLFNCEKFRALTADKRREEIEKLSMCVRCLRSHESGQCKSSHVCRECGQQHSTLLHNSGVNSESANTASLTHKSSSGILSTAIVRTRARGNEWQKARAMIDTGATACFMRQSYADALGIKFIPCHVKVTGFTDNGEPMIVRRRIETFLSNENGSPKHLLNFFIVPKISKQTPESEFPAEEFGIPENFNLADPAFNIPAPIDILIGNNIARKLETGHIHDLNNGVQLVSTIFGYTLAGDVSSGVAVANRITVTECNLGILKELNANIEKFYRLEDYANEKRAYTSEEIFCEEHFQKTHKRLPNGKFQVKIPFKPSLSQLGDNSKSAFSQFMSTEKKLQREQNQKVRKDYVDFMDEYEETGHMSKVKVPQGDVGYYLPHHPVFNPDSTTTKTRIVFNGSSASSSGMSLNDVQCTGPVIQPDAVQLLLRFRQHKTVVKGDISKFYRTIEVDPEQRKYQRIYWRKSLDDPLDTYELNTVTYGLSSSSFLSARCLKQLAIENKDKYPEASKSLEEDFFVDDLLTGAPTTEAAIKLKNEITEILDEAHMKLRKFISNSPEFIDSLSDEDREKCTNTDENFKALGIVWNVKDDIITFNIDYQPLEKFTKRNILSSIAKPMALDPTGLLAPVVLKFKIFMKKIHQLKTTWDAALPTTLTDEWNLLTETLPDVNKIKIPRRVVLDDFVKIQLICCCDASKDAYGASVYVRSINKKGEINCQLLDAKSHVAQDGVDMPKLELSSLVVAATLLQTVAKNFIFAIDEIIIFSDSTIALSWIKNGAKGQSTFVFNRVQKIRNIAQDVKFMHIRTELNPADWVSRGLLAAEILQDHQSDQFWWRGPLFFSQPEEEWPDAIISFNMREAEIDDYFCENDTIRCCHATTTTNEEQNIIFNIVENSKSFFEAKRKIASLLQLVSLCKAKVNKRPQLISPIGLKQFQQAELTIAREYQRVFMPCEYKLLSTGKNIAPTSKYLSLAPFWNAEQEIIRVGGRTQHADIPYNHKHQILLPKCPLNKILALETHHQLLHAGKKSIVATLKQRYWPIAIAVTARQVVRKCNDCFRVNPKMAEQLMAPLPSDRLNPVHPFYITGVDFAGPFTYKTSKLRNAKVDKAYIALFVCFHTKAVHIEVLSSLTTEDFLMCLDRFISHCGKPRKIWSDNGGSFQGANNELKRIHDFLTKNRKEFKNYFEKQEIQWKFIPPRSPNFGGLWEANVKIAKRHFYTYLQDAHLTFEEMATVCCRITAIMNSRPLFVDCEDPNDYHVITPSHLTHGRALTTMPEPDLSDPRFKYKTLQRYDRVLQIQQQMWKLLKKEHLAEQQKRSKNLKRNFNIQLGMKAMIHVENTPSLYWPVGKIVKLYPGEDNLIRVVDVETPDGVYKRAISKIAILPTEINDEE